MYFIVKYVWRFSINSGGAWSLQCTSDLQNASFYKRRKTLCWFWSALFPWWQRGRVTCMTWYLNRGRISLCLMYLSDVVIKHLHGCHQVQRGILLAILCRVLSLMATHLMKMMATYLMKLSLMEYVLMNLLNDVNLMYLQWVQKVMKKGIQYVLELWWKEHVSRNMRTCLGEVAYARGK